MKEYDLFRDIAARLNKYGIIQDLPGILEVYGLTPSPPPDIVRGKRFAIRSEDGRFTVHRLNEWGGRVQFGRELQTARQRLGLSVEEVARLADFTASTIRRMEAGGFAFSIDQAARVADVLKCDITLTPH